MGVNENITAKLVETLYERAEDICNSGKYKECLDRMAMFHNYSARNCVLIMDQKPDASYVAGMRSWEKDFGRQVNKGEKAIRILAPCIYKKEIPEVVTDKDNIPVLDEKGEIVKKLSEVEVTGFKTAYVFDISQTRGKEFVNPSKKLAESVKDSEKLRRAVENEAGCKVIYGNTAAGVNSFYSGAKDMIVINKSLSEEMKLKALIREAVNSRMNIHDTVAERNAVSTDRLTRAKSVAYVLSARLGADTSDYAFGNSDFGLTKDHKELLKSLDVIKKEADAIYTGVCRTLGMEPVIKPVSENRSMKAVM